MNNKFIALTPFSRNKNKQILIEHLGQFNIKWIPITQDATIFPGDWISSVYSGLPDNWRTWEDGNIVSWKVNWFIEHCNIDDSSYYLILCDDCFYEQGFFNKIDNISTSVGIVSMKRGDNIVGEGQQRHPNDTLIANPNNMTISRVGIEQFIIRGDILKTLHFDSCFVADGIMATKLKDYDVTYYENTFVLFNYLEEGRYNK
jgi:hypothetical protein